MTRILITGVAGFIGSHVAQALIARGDDVVGIDDLNDYYDVSLKRERLKRIVGPACRFHEVDFADEAALQEALQGESFDVICHLGAQAGVRYSLTHPEAYEHSNVRGTLNLFEHARKTKVPKVVYASSSSVYGANTKVPFSVKDPVETPLSIYAVTKRANELMAHSYHHLYGMDLIGLRFFTVYGPWGRPDMALFTFTKAILAGKPIDVYNNGDMQRDFTFISDIVAGVLAAIDKGKGYALYNLGNNDPVTLLDFIACIENALGKKAEKRLLPLQAGDVPKTYADISESQRDLGYEPKVRIDEGIAAFITWYKERYGVQ